MVPSTLIARFSISMTHTITKVSMPSTTLEKWLSDTLLDMNETLGARLKRLRKERGLSQTQLAQAAGVGQSAIGNIEANSRGYGKGVVQIAALLGVNSDYLLMNTDDPDPVAAPVRPNLSYEAERFHRWLYKIKDKDLRERTADAAMQVVYRALDGLSAPLPTPTEEPSLPGKKPRASRQEH